MNKKFFTLLACALMMLSVAFQADAQWIGSSSVGPAVGTLKVDDGKSYGVNHLRVDAILMDAAMLAKYGESSITFNDDTTHLWVPLSYEGAKKLDNIGKLHSSFGGTSGLTSESDLKDTTNYSYLRVDSIGEKAVVYSISRGEQPDTVIVSVAPNESAYMISANQLRDAINDNDGADLSDLQAAYWCVEEEYGEVENQGHWPTYTFTNKIFGKDLDHDGGTQLVDNSDEKGWMFSNTGSSHLQKVEPLYREKDDTNRYFLAADIGIDSLSGMIRTKSVSISAYNNELKADSVNMSSIKNRNDDNLVTGMIMFTLVESTPIVLNAEMFNTALGTNEEERTKLTFSREVSEVNPFGKYFLEATESGNTEDPTNIFDRGYLNIQVYDEAKGGESLGYIANKHGTDDDEEAYNTSAFYGKNYLNLLVKEKDDVELSNDTAATGYNYSYRFVYFPSTDSLVINAFAVKQHGDTIVWDDSTYVTNCYDENGDGVEDYCLYGLYNTTMTSEMLVSYQDLDGPQAKAVAMMSLGGKPDTRISLGVLNCEETKPEDLLVLNGVFTIWDDRGRCLGVRIYNGSYAPQWMELEEGECPDRIPSYQWVVEPAKDATAKMQGRVDITSREFGNLVGKDVPLLKMENIAVEKDKTTRIFSGQKTVEDSYLQNLVGDPSQTNLFEPIYTGKVAGKAQPSIGPTVCKITEESGFRPVTADYLADEYLGYKHFHVNNGDSTDLSFGKSEDKGNEKGMDYNAFAFNYLHDYNENTYIDLKGNYADTLLIANPDAKTGFQFMLGSNLRNRAYLEEEYGYGEGLDDIIGSKMVEGEPESVGGYNTTYKGEVTKVPQLKRYYYELKVSDFYHYRDDYAEQFVVLKGAKDDNSDLRNKLKYGVADAFHSEEALKYANVYLRETYFLERERKKGEERHQADPSRRIYYALLDRIERGVVGKVTDMGLEVSDTLRFKDGGPSESDDVYNLVTLSVEDFPGWIKAQGKTVSSARVSTFALENLNFELYRRLRSSEHDGAVPEGDGIDPEAPAQLDAPKTLRLHTHRNTADYLYEDRLSEHSYIYSGTSFLGLSNIYQNPEEYAADGLVKYNYNLFIDTAYINRGTGWIKPQYLIGVAQNVVELQEIIGIDACGDEVKDTILPYTEARYLINATDSARLFGGPIVDDRYVFATSWDRLIFVPAIHTDDRLYLVREMEKLGVNRSDYIITTEDGNEYIDAVALRTLTAGHACSPNNTTMPGVYYDFGEWNNYHNDVTFSLRYVNPDVVNPDAEGNDTHSNEDKRFLIESETTNRTSAGNRKIAPVQGGWIKIQANMVPVISRGSYEDAINMAEIFNVELPNDWQNGQATDNEQAVEAKVGVIGGTGEVTVLNGAGKRATVTNLLGQTVADVVLTSDRQTVKVAKGVAIVTVEGEKSVKAIIK